MRRAIIPATLVTLFLVAVQLEIFSSLRFDGVVVMLIWLWPLCMGLCGFTPLALFVALVGGVLFDAHAVTPFALTAVVGLVLGYAASRLGKEGIGDLDSAAIWVTPVIAAVGGFVAPLLFTVGGFFTLNFSLWHGSLVGSMLVNAIAFFLLARPMSRLAKSIASLGERGRR